MKRFGKTLLALTLAGSVAGMAQAADNKVLHVYNWSDYIAPDTPEKFTKETGIKVVYDVYDSNEVLEAVAGGQVRVRRGGAVQLLPRQADQGRGLPEARQVQAAELEEPEQGPDAHPEVSDPGNEHAIPYMWGTIGIGYNPDKVKAAFGDNAPVDSWDLVFKPENIQKLKQCGVSFLDSPTEILPAALHYLGYKPDTDNPKELKAAEELFLKIRPYVTYFHSSKYISDLANGNICVAIGYSGDIYQAKSRAEEAKNKVTVKYNIPKEGAGSFFDMVAIPKDAENTEGALAFVNFLMKPEIMAEITDVVQFPNGNAAATPLVSEAIRNDPGIYPSEEVMKKLYTFPDLPAKTQRAMTRSWTKIKSGK
ncbi:polyamine ABC transporter substrate-binding protein [Pseudomonas aeruginosa]|nr:polyamine ABC transporter substrate-binding protein [Pseudomonas aeruginosa]